MTRNRGHQKRPPDAKCMEDFCNNFGAVCAVLLSSARVQDISGQENRSIHGKFVKFDGLHRQQGACLVQSQVLIQHNIEIHAYRAILVSPSLESKIHCAVLHDREAHCFFVIKIVLVGVTWK